MTQSKRSAKIAASATEFFMSHSIEECYCEIASMSKQSNNLYTDAIEYEKVYFSCLLNILCFPERAKHFVRQSKIYAKKANNCLEQISILTTKSEILSKLIDTNINCY